MADVTGGRTTPEAINLLLFQHSSHPGIIASLARAGAEAKQLVHDHVAAFDFVEEMSEIGTHVYNVEEMTDIFTNLETCNLERVDAWLKMDLEFAKLDNVMSFHLCDPDYDWSDEQTYPALFFEFIREVFKRRGDLTDVYFSLRAHWDTADCKYENGVLTLPPFEIFEGLDYTLPGLHTICSGCYHSIPFPVGIPGVTTYRFEVNPAYFDEEASWLTIGYAVVSYALESRLTVLIYDDETENSELAELFITSIILQLEDYDEEPMPLRQIVAPFTDNQMKELKGKYPDLELVVA